jgi:hypothetical protein
VTVAWIALAFLLVGVPLLAWWLGGRRFWSRLRPGSERDVYRELVRRHALTPTEAAKVEEAVNWGRELHDPRLRAAVVDWAQTLQADARERTARHPWVRRVLTPLVVGAGLLALAGVVQEVRSEGWSALADHVWALLWLLPVVWSSPRPRRAIARNSDPGGAP